MVVEIQLFSKGTWNIGRPIVAEEVLWFRGKDVATSLGYAKTCNALERHVEPEDKVTFAELTTGVCQTDAIPNQQPHEVYINESGLYSLVLRSNKPRAKSFKRWVTNEVLPSIRRHGAQLAMDERPKNQEQTLSAQRQLLMNLEQALSGQRQLLVNQEQKVLASCALASAAVNVRLKNQDDSLSAQGQLLVDQGELLSRIHADMKERLRDQDQRLSAQGRLLSRILEVLDNGRLADVDTEFAEGSDDKPRRVTLRACASKRSVSDSGSLPESCAKVSRKRACVSEHLASDCGSLAVVVAGFDPAGAREFDEPLSRPEQFTAVVNACRRFLDYTANNEKLRAVVERHGLYRTLSKRRSGGGEEKNLRDLCFRRGGRDAMIRYGGIPVYGKFGRSEHWGSMLCCLRDHGLADELTTETSRQPVKIFKLRRGHALGREATEVLGGWGLLSSTIDWLQIEPS